MLNLTKKPIFRKGQNNCEHLYCVSQNVSCDPDVNPTGQLINMPCNAIGIIDVGVICDSHLTAENLQDLKEARTKTNLIIEDFEFFLINSESLLANTYLYFTLVNPSEDDLKRLEPLLTESNSRFFWFYSIQGEQSFFFSPQQIENIKSTFPQLTFNPPLTGRLYHPGWSDFQDRTPPIEDFIDEREFQSFKLSIVIPVYNHKEELFQTLQRVIDQDLHSSQFEILIIDDGSDFRLANKVREFFGTKSENSYFYCYLPRPKERDFGDNGWRSMVARNLGVKYSKSENVLFLDSDILLEKNFLTQLLIAHESYDVVQPLRWHLTEAKDFSLTKSRSNNYFEDFQNIETAWNSREYFWKYSSTFCFSVKKELFKQVGWFSKSFCFYGFDDVELGYRLYKAGAKFHLLRENVYALFHEIERSEYQNDPALKNELHTKSATLFYHQNLDTEIYDALKFYY